MGLNQKYKTTASAGQINVVRLTCLDIIIAVDWDVKLQNKLPVSFYLYMNLLI